MSDDAAENAILCDYAEKLISAMEAVEQLQEIGFEPVRALMLLRAWHDHVAEYEGPDWRGERGFTQ